MHIVFALGTHRPMTDEEMVKAVGKDVASRLKMYNSLAMNRKTLSTSARLPAERRSGSISTFVTSTTSF